MRDHHPKDDGGAATPKFKSLAACAFGSVSTRGNIIHDETRVYGDGVNVAARLESMAESGGICISSEAYDEIWAKVAVTFEGLGLQQLKNIAQLVHVYRVQAEQVARSDPRR